ncbi:MAG: hypothetical protein QXO80_03045 [Thermosphaera sp.]
MSISCEELSSLPVLFEKTLGVDALVGLQVVLAYGWKKLGRVGASKILKMSERRVRRIIDSLRKYGFVKNAGSPGLLEIVLSAFQTDLIFKGEGLYLVAYKPFSKAVLDLVKSRIVEFRDYLVIGCRSPADFLMIGISSDNDGGVEFPRVPSKYSQPLMKTIASGEVKNSLIIAWRTYEPIRSDALVLYALSRLCSSGWQEKQLYS